MGDILRCMEQAFVAAFVWRIVLALGLRVSDSSKDRITHVKGGLHIAARFRRDQDWSWATAYPILLVGYRQHWQHTWPIFDNSKAL